MCNTTSRRELNLVYLVLIKNICIAHSNLGCGLGVSVFRFHTKLIYWLKYSIIWCNAGRVCQTVQCVLFVWQNMKLTTILAGPGRISGWWILGLEGLSQEVSRTKTMSHITYIKPKVQKKRAHFGPMKSWNWKILS